MKLLSSLFGKSEDTIQFSYDEKHYPLGVLVLVFFMTVFVFSLGERALSDISDGIPTIHYPYLHELQSYENAQDFWGKEVRPLRDSLYEAGVDLDRIRGAYDSTLLENLAGEKDRLYGEPSQIRSQVKLTTQEVSRLKDKLDDVEEKYQGMIASAEAEYKVLEDLWRVDNKWRQAKVFAWEALFWLPFFLLTLSWHTRSKKKQSKWEIISLSSYIAASLLALQSTCVLLWSWIPRRLLEILWELLSATLLTRIIGYYVMVGIVIFIFGACIIFIHRRMTDPVRGGRKRIRNGGCPTCSYPLSLSSNYCGGCGSELKQDCKSCKKPHFTWEAACSNCGNAAPQ
ncbi:MAG: zinc ribbon domain-containing protein [bacterium]|nr:zinc ribbon domain-containing protein [bacterium]